MNLPTKITVARICLIPIFVFFFYFTNLAGNYFYAALVFSIAATTDALDGYLARKLNLVTNMGKFLDPIADKVLVSTAYIVMLTSSIMPALIGGICVSLILARELIISGFRMLAAGTGLVLAADNLGKIKTVLQILSILTLLISATCTCQSINTIGLIILILATIITILSGLNYIVKNRQVLKSEE